MKIFIVGGTGFVGVSLANRLRARGDGVTAMGTSAERPRGLDPEVPVVAGDGRAPGAWQEAIAGHDVVVNLAGSSIFERWTDATKRLLRESRILTTRNVVAALPADATLVSTSAVGYYGFRGDEELDEAAPPGEDFLARLCVAWEGEALRARERGGRTVVTRFGLVSGYELLSEIKMGERVIASPVAVANRLLIRGHNHLFCIGEKEAPGGCQPRHRYEQPQTASGVGCFHGAR